MSVFIESSAASSRDPPSLRVWLQASPTKNHSSHFCWAPATPAASCTALGCLHTEYQIVKYTNWYKWPLYVVSLYPVRTKWYKAQQYIATKPIFLPCLLELMLSYNTPRCRSGGLQNALPATWTIRQIKCTAAHAAPLAQRQREA